MTSKPLLVVAGGGAAGFFCAVNAARLNPELKVLLLEKSSKLLSKVKISGGGRCNVTHYCFDIRDLITKYPRGQNFLKKALHWFGPSDTIEWFNDRGVRLKVEKDGRMFPDSDKSQAVIDCLMEEAKKYHVEILLNTEIKAFEKKGDSFELFLSGSKTITSNFLCIACGGYPKSTQFNWLINTGHSIEAPVPSLFSFNLEDKELNHLAGISVEKVSVKLKGGKLSSTGPVLITHWGLSGPAILKLSAFGARELAALDYNFEIIVNWLYGLGFTDQELQLKWIEIKSKHASKFIQSKNPFGLSGRLWEYFLMKAGIEPMKRWADINNKEQQKLIGILTCYPLAIKGKTTFKEEFVTAGGIKLNEINPNTMESKIIPNLFFAGEIMNVDGITGGFNFQHAWTSGFIAARAIGERK